MASVHGCAGAICLSLLRRICDGVTWPGLPVPGSCTRNGPRGCMTGTPSCSASRNGVPTRFRGRARTRPAWAMCTCRSRTVTTARTGRYRPRCGAAGTKCPSLLLSTTPAARSITGGGTGSLGSSGRTSSTLGTPSCSATRHTGVPRKSRSWFGMVGE